MPERSKQTAQLAEHSVRKLVCTAPAEIEFFSGRSAKRRRGDQHQLAGLLEADKPVAAAREQRHPNAGAASHLVVDGGQQRRMATAVAQHPIEHQPVYSGRARREAANAAQRHGQVPAGFLA